MPEDPSWHRILGEVPAPTLEQQEQYWTDWLVRNRYRSVMDDDFRSTVATIARDFVTRHRPGTALEVGCGTGWLSGAIAPLVPTVVATDLSTTAVALARCDHPDCTFVAGNFLDDRLSLPDAPYGAILSCDAIGHVTDHDAFVRRCRSLLRDGGALLLITQNPLVWSRTRYLVPVGQGQIRNWPSRQKLMGLFQRSGIHVVRTSTFLPIGDTRLLFWRPYAQGALRRVIGRRRAQRLFERLGFGRGLVFEAVVAGTSLPAGPV